MTTETAHATDFVHLHVHSDFSLLDGNCRLDDLCARAAELGMSAVALTDHGNLFGAVSFYKAARKHGIKPIIGMEGYLSATTRHERRKGVNGKKKDTYHITLLSRSNEGFQNLIKLSSIAYLEGFYYRPRMDKELLRQYGEGLICLSGCLSGELIQTVRHDGKEAAKKVIAEYQEIFGEENYFIEIMHNGADYQDHANDQLIELARETGTPLIATNDVHYIKKSDREAQDVLLCIGTGKLKDDPDRFKMGSEVLYLRSTEEMHELFGDVAAEALENTRKIAERCEIEIDFDSRLLPAFQTPEGFTSEEYFQKLCEEGVAELYPEGGDAVRERLDYEMGIILQMGFVDYFLIVWDFIRYAREQGIPVGPGRGSAAGSIVAYALGITKIDPLKYDLLFERFLNAERISMPDIDIDFCKDGREQVIQYVAEKYGSDRVAQIITFGTMAAKGVIRDVGRVLNVSLGDVDTISKKIPVGPKITLTKSLAEDEELRQLRERDAVSKELFDVALKIEGSARHCSVHAAGVVITDVPLMERVPLYKNGDSITTQWPMDIVEEIGLLKMDFLGLRTLTIIDKALKLIERHRGEVIDIDAVPLDDGPAFELLARADTQGVFQLESDGMKELLRKLKPDAFEDIIAVLALYRPGPLGSGMDEMYWKRKHGIEKVEYLHPLLEPILGESNAVILYQEQVMRIAAILGGFSLNEADSLRKAMGKKKPEILAKFKKQFVAGGEKNDVPAKIAEEIWEQIEYFAGYGFNKSHSTAYALVTYHTAWLKANYPIEFMAALMTCEMISTDKTVEYIAESQAMDIEVLPPDVNHSTWEFAVEGDKIRYALGAIRGVGQKGIDAMTTMREKEEKTFGDIYELAESIDPQLMNKTVFEALIHAGAMDALEGNRGQNLAAIEQALRMAHSAAEDRRSGQMSLFGDAADSDDGGEVGKMALPDVPELPESERLQREKDALGFYLSGHPLNEWRHHIEKFAAHTIDSLERRGDSEKVIVGGIIRQVRLMLTKRGRYEGKRMAFVSFEDFTGTVDGVVFASVYADAHEHVKEDSIVFLEGKVDRKRSNPVLIVDRIISLDEAREQLTDRVTLSMNSEDDVEMQILAVKRLLKEHPGHVPIQFMVSVPEIGRVTVQAGQSFGVKPSAQLFESLATLLGERQIIYN